MNRLILVLLLLSALLRYAQASNDERPRYTLTSSYNALLFSNTDEFQVIREMCWNSSVGWCDLEERATELWLVTDWDDEVTGAIYQVKTGECFWWMFQPDYGTDHHPHVREHYWIECP